MCRMASFPISPCRPRTWSSRGTARLRGCGCIGDWIAADRRGLTICDATSAVFAMRLLRTSSTWVIAETWAGRGHTACWRCQHAPSSGSKLHSTLVQALPADLQGQVEGVFRGETINTPSMLCVEDALEFTRMGGIQRVSRGSSRGRNATWHSRPWPMPLAGSGHDLLHVAAVENITEAWFTRLSPEERFQTVRAMTRRLEGAAYDIASHRAPRPAHLRPDPRSRRPMSKRSFPGSTGLKQQRRTAKAA